MNKDKDPEANYDTKGPENMDADASFIPEVPEYHEVPVEGERY